MESMVSQSLNAAPVRLSERAVAMVKQTLASQKLEGYVLRIGLVPGGCAGFSYDLDMVPSAAPGDVRFEQDGVTIAVAPKSVAMLQGTEVDYVQDGLSAGFAFKNPNAKSACGCGHSFQG